MTSSSQPPNSNECEPNKVPRHLSLEEWAEVYQQARQLFTDNPGTTNLLQLVEFDPPAEEPPGNDGLVLLFTWSHTLNEPVLLYSVRWLECDKVLARYILRQIA